MAVRLHADRARARRAATPTLDAARRAADASDDREPEPVGDERAAGDRRLAQDRAGRGARAARADRGPRRRSSCATCAAPPTIHEAVAISTCNRTELYLVVGDPVEAESTVLAMLARQAEIRPTELASAIYSQRNCDAARHLYRVTAGLESMIVGEAEIQGQVKRAYEAALGRGDDRAAHQPPVPGRAGHRQARAHRDRDRRAPAQPAGGRGRAGRASSSATSTAARW